MLSQEDAAAEVTPTEVNVKPVDQVPGLNNDNNNKGENQERNENVGEIPSVEPTATPASDATTEREALCDIKVPDHFILDRKVLLRPDKCPCTLCRWFLYEVSQQVERFGTTSLETQADMLRDSCPLLALYMSKDHRSAILWDIGFQQYLEKKYLSAAKALCWSMFAAEGGVGGYFRVYDQKMVSDIYTQDKVKNTRYGRLLRTYAKTKIASFYGAKRHPEHMVMLMLEAYGEFEALLGEFEDNRDRSFIRFNMCKISHCVSNYQKSRQSSEILAKSYQLWEISSEEDWSFLPTHKWLAEDCRAKARWEDAEAMYRVCAFLVEADNPYSADIWYTLAYTTVKRLLGGGGKTQDGSIIPAQAPVTDFGKSVLEYLTEVMKVATLTDKLNLKVYGKYDTIVKLENLPFHPKKEAKEFLSKYGIIIDEPVVPPFESDRGPDGKGEIKVDDINLQIPQVNFCSYCFADGNGDADFKLKKCKNCEQVKYCGPQCQKKHWAEGNHKKYCKMLSKAAKFPKISL